MIDLHDVELAILTMVAVYDDRQSKPMPYDDLAEASAVEYAQFVRRINYLRRHGLLTIIPAAPTLTSRDQRVALTADGELALEAERVARTRIARPGRRSRVSSLAGDSAQRQR